MFLDNNTVQRDAETTPRHHCLIYQGDPVEKLPLLAFLIRKNLEDNYRCLYLNSPAMVAGLRSCLAAMGVNIAAEVDKGRLLLSSQQPAAGAAFNSDHMLALLEDAIDSAISDGYNGLWATGDMSWEFGEAKNFNVLLEYECGLEDLFRKRKELRGVCQYHRDTLPSQVMRTGMLTHPCIVINETLSRINPHYLRSALSEAKTTTDAVLNDVIAELCKTA